ncbi:MAG: DUF4349 domain-containing protein [Bacillota bacterium]|jgi:hypothetical protein|nr:DUF4349 domain-containing protein [Bacillota bacterium]HHU42867.1 DUF4349 domain-containing protein [Clostridiales bacterium]
MKRKFFIILIVLITMVFTLSACAQNDAGPRYEQDVQEDTGYDIIINKSNRKIIYTFRIEMTTKNLNDTVERITKLVKKNPEDQNWIQDSEHYQSGSYRHTNLTVRIKTDKLNDFLSELSKTGKITNRSHSTTDITYSYASAEAKIAALKEEKQYLEEMLDEADNSGKILYVDRISEINSELLLLEQELVKYDSDIEYSTIHIYIEDVSPQAKPAFGKRLKDAALGSLQFAFEALKWIVIALIYVIPFAIVGGGIAVIVIVVKKKKKEKRDKKTDDKK